MRKTEKVSEIFVQQQMEKLRQTPPRNLEKAARGRSQFLAQARLAAARVNSRQTVSNVAPSRLIGWIGLIRNPLHRKEQHSMIAVFSSLVVILALLLGGAGATVYAAQDSLPNQGLYPLKIASEDIQLHLAKSEQKQLNLQLAYADRRVSELAALIAAGEPAPEQLASRFENHLRLALQLAAGMDEEAVTPALLQIRTHMRSQERLMEMMHSNMPAAADPVLARVRTMLRQQINLLDEGLSDPQNFRNQLHYQYIELEGTPRPETSPFGTGQGTRACSECTPVMDGSGPGSGPGSSQYGQTPEPGQGVGPGPAATPSQAPGGYNEGDGGGSPSATKEPGGGNPDPSQAPGGGGNPDPDQDPGGQGSGGSVPGGSQGHP